MQPLLKDIEAEKRKNGRVALEKRWRRRMKLTPCIVSTFFMLPFEMKVSRREAGGFVDDYLYHFADLLIVDEAGQVLPEVAAASFALSKRAMVIGDTLQIEPMWSLPARVDIGNLVKARLLPEVEYEKFFQHLSDIGKTVSAGSVMRIAQYATRYHYDPDLPRGLFLYEHRRCFDEIIPLLQRAVLPRQTDSCPGDEGSCRRATGQRLRRIAGDGISAHRRNLVVLENNNGFLTQLLAEGRPLCRSLPESLSASVLVSCQEVGPGEPESAAVQSVRPSAW
jgi:hypothetical protein